MPSEDGASGTTMEYLQLCMHLFISSAVAAAWWTASRYKEFAQGHTHVRVAPISLCKHSSWSTFMSYSHLAILIMTFHVSPFIPKGLVHEHSGFYDERVFKREDCMPASVNNSKAFMQQRPTTYMTTYFYTMQG